MDLMLYLMNKNQKLTKLIKEKNNDRDIVRKAIINDNEIIRWLNFNIYI